VGSGAGAQREDSTAKISGLTNCDADWRNSVGAVFENQDVQQKL